MPQLTPTELWQMPPSEFNKWRRENDLRVFFERLEHGLPHFAEWMAVNNLTATFILSTDKPGNFFYWDKDVYWVKSVKGEFVSFSFYQVYDEKHEKDMLNSFDHPEENEVLKASKFTPYFLWVKLVKKLTKPIKSHYSGALNTFRYTSGSAPDSPEHCQWVISPGITVLKLGGTQIESWVTLLGRNLDFTNLDFLEIKGEGSWSSGTEIFYSHCENIKLTEVEAQFTDFYECSFAKLRVINSKLYGLTFYQCNFFQSFFENVSISNLAFVHCPVSGLTFNRVETNPIIYLPPAKHYYDSKGGTYDSVSKNFKQLRVLYQLNGMRQEASEAYYSERFYEMKGLWSSSHLWKSAYRFLKYRNIYSWRAFKDDFSKSIQYLSDFIAYGLWGFGERPLRIIGTSLLLIVLYSFAYVQSPIPKAQGDWINSVYFSTVTFTTLGFGDISPLETSGAWYKIFVASEALTGGFCMGLIVAGFANKSRY